MSKLTASQRNNLDLLNGYIGEPLFTEDDVFVTEHQKPLPDYEEYCEELRLEAEAEAAKSV